MQEPCNHLAKRRNLERRSVRLAGLEKSHKSQEPRTGERPSDQTGGPKKEKSHKRSQFALKRTIKVRVRTELQIEERHRTWYRPPFPRVPRRDRKTNLQIIGLALATELQRFYMSRYEEVAAYCGRHSMVLGGAGVHCDRATAKPRSFANLHSHAFGVRWDCCHSAGDRCRGIGSKGASRRPAFDPNVGQRDISSARCTGRQRRGRCGGRVR